LIWSEMGTIGFVAYCALLLIAVFRALTLIRQGHPIYAVVALGLLAALVATMVYMLAEPFVRRPLINLVWLNFGLLEALMYLQRREANPASKPLADDSGPTPEQSL
jgi:O-antigen ligase